MRRISSILLPCLAFAILVLAAPFVDAQIMDQIDADVHHSFIVGNATLPPGQYVFRMMPGTDMQVMTARSASGDAAVEFLVRNSIDSRTPNHTELIFDRYGSKEFLTHVYEIGNKVGIAVIEPSREESRLLKQGQHPVEHTEEQ
jgi:hypothetical protein